MALSKVDYRQNLLMCLIEAFMTLDTECIQIAHEVVGEGNKVGAESFCWCVEQRDGANYVGDILPPGPAPPRPLILEEFAEFREEYAPSDPMLAISNSLEDYKKEEAGTSWPRVSSCMIMVCGNDCRVIQLELAASIEQKDRRRLKDL
eukprot:scaffold4467_cov170-Skeletonema_marinoi.AAC.5